MSKHSIPIFSELEILQQEPVVQGRYAKFSIPRGHCNERHFFSELKEIKWRCWRHICYLKSTLGFRIFKCPETKLARRSRFLGIQDLGWFYILHILHPNGVPFLTHCLCTIALLSLPRQFTLSPTLYKAFLEDEIPHEFVFLSEYLQHL